MGHHGALHVMTRAANSDTVSKRVSTHMGFASIAGSRHSSRAGEVEENS